MGQGFKPTPYILSYTIYINEFMYFLPIMEQDYIGQLDSDKSYYCYNHGSEEVFSGQAGFKLEGKEVELLHSW